VRVALLFELLESSDDEVWPVLDVRLGLSIQWLLVFPQHHPSDRKRTSVLPSLGSLSLVSRFLESVLEGDLVTLD
jgi:hypothetical protein